MRFNFGEYFQGEPENGISSGWNFLEIDNGEITLVEDYDVLILTPEQAIEAVQDRYDSFFEDNPDDIIEIIKEAA